MNQTARAGKISAFITQLLAFLLFASLVLAAILGMSAAGSILDDRAVDSAREAVRRAALSCYALEGAYPSDIAYLTEHYGLQLDDRFIYHYAAAGSNIMPDIDVLPRN